MPSILTPVVNNYRTGRGAVFFDAFAPGTQSLTGEMFLGDCKGFNVAIKTTQTDHYQSTGGVKVMDESAAIQADASGQIQSENVDANQLSRFLFASGGPQTITQAAGAIAPEQIGPVLLGAYYQLGRAGGANPVGVQSLSTATKPVVKNGAGTTTYVEGVDYLVDYTMARIQPLPGGSITSGETLSVGYSLLAVSKTRVTAGTKPMEGAVRYISDNSTGSNDVWYLPWVKLVPNGTYDAIGDKFAEITFDLKVLLLSSASTFMFVDGIGV